MGSDSRPTGSFDFDGVAKAVFAESVQHQAAAFLNAGAQKTYNIPDSFSAKFNEKVYLYFFAALLRALLVAEQTHPSLRRLRESVEGLVFTMPEEEGAQDALRVREAMIDLEALMTRHGDFVYPNSWAAAWFREFNVSITNPITSEKFELHWAYACRANQVGIESLIKEFAW
jgi:hypothetical protein